METVRSTSGEESKGERQKWRYKAGWWRCCCGRRRWRAEGESAKRIKPGGRWRWWNCQQGWLSRSLVGRAVRYLGTASHPRPHILPDLSYRVKVPNSLNFNTPFSIRFTMTWGGLRITDVTSSLLVRSHPLFLLILPRVFIHLPAPLYPQLHRFLLFRILPQILL